jgi:hypothetical protein
MGRGLGGRGLGAGDCSRLIVGPIKTPQWLRGWFSV